MVCSFSWPGDYGWTKVHTIVELGVLVERGGCGDVRDGMRGKDNDKTAMTIAQLTESCARGGNDWIM